MDLPIREDVFSNFVSEQYKGPFQFERREKPGYEVIRNDDQLTLRVGKLTGDDLINIVQTLQTVNEIASNGSISGKSPANQYTGLRACELNINDAVISALVLVERRESAEIVIVPRDPNAENYERGYSVIGAKITVWGPLPSRQVNDLAELLAKDKSGGRVDTVPNPDRFSWLEHKTGFQDRFMIPALLLLTAAIGTGLYFGVLAQSKPPIGPVYR